MKQHIGTAAICIAALLLLAGCQDWTGYMGDPALNGTSAQTSISTSNINTLTPVAYGDGWGPAQPYDPSPTVSAGLMYETSDSAVYAMDVNGSKNCSGAPTLCGAVWAGLFPTTPQTTWWDSQPVDADGYVYVTTSGVIGGGRLAAYDAAGVKGCTGSAPAMCQPLWTAPVDSRSAVVVDGAHLFVTDSYHGELEAFDAYGSSGCSGTPTVCQPLWTAPINSQVTPAVAEGRVYVTSWDPSTPVMAAYDEDGVQGCSGAPVVCQPLFEASLPGPSQSSVDVSGGVAYLETTRPPVLVAVDGSGVTNCAGTPTICQPLWTGALPSTFYSAAAGNTPAVANGRVYASSYQPEAGDLSVFDAAGQQNCSVVSHTCAPLWSSHVSMRSFQGSSPVVTNGLVFVADQGWDANGVDNCTTNSGTTTCTPIWHSSRTLDGGEAPTVTVAEGKVFLFGVESEPAIYKPG